MKKPKNDKAGQGASSTRSRGSLSVAVLSTGVAAVLLAAAAGVAWGLHVEAESRGRARVHEVRGAAAMLSKSVERAFLWKDLEGLPDLLQEAATQHDLTVCRVRVPGEKPIAEAGSPVVGEMPEAFADAIRKRDEVADGSATLVIPVRVGTQGEVALEVSAGVDAAWTPALAKLGLPLVSAAGVVALLLGFKAISKRLAVLGTIGKALEASRLGTSDGQPPLVAESLGEQATAWNVLVQERETYKRFSAFKEAAEPGRGGRVSSDLSAACDAMTQGIVILDEHLKVKYANGAAASFLGAKRDELVGSDIRKYVTDSDAIAAFEGVVSGKVRQRVSVETSRVGAQGRIVEAGIERAASVLKLSARPVRREEQGVVMVTVEDVTQQRVADEARNSFVAQATHELRTPLTNIRLYTEAMIEDSDNPEIRTKALNVISSESRRLERIVADMLSVSEIEAGTLKIVRGDVRLDQLFEELKDDYRVQAEDKEIAMIFELPPKLPVVSADRDKYALALHNLIGNALKYTPAGGKVTIRAEEAQGKFLVHVIDNGIGIKKEEQELVFDKFYRAKDGRVANLTGTGLGLTLARDVARMHGGNINLQSEINKGSTFTLEIPLAAEAGAVRAAA